MTARTTDPATSHLAATYINGKRPGLKDAFLQALRVLGPSTANEIAQWCVQAGVSANQESVRKRAKELVDEGSAKYGPQKTCKVTGQQAGTLELCNATNNGNATKSDRRTSPGNSGLTGTSESASGEVRGVRVDSQHDSQRQTIPSLEAERIEAVVSLIKRERDWIDNWRIALDITVTRKAGASWPDGSTDDYVRAMDVAGTQGLIECRGNQVRAKRVEVEAKAVQGSLFAD